MVDIKGVLYMSWKDLYPYGYTEKYLKLICHQFSSGISKSYENIKVTPELRIQYHISNNVRVLIRYSSIPEKSITERNIPTEAQLRASFATTSIKQAVKDFAGLRLDQAINFYKSNPNTYPLANELSEQSAWLLFMAALKHKQARALGCGNVQDCYTKAMHLMDQEQWEKWKCNSLQVLRRKLRPFIKLFKKPLNGDFSLEQYHEALASLVHGNFGNKNREKMDEQMEAAIFTLYANGHAKLTETQVYAMYTSKALDKISAGEWTDKALISESTIKNFLNRPDIKQAYYRQRYGRQAYRNTFEIITRRRPASTANGLWIMDGTPVHLYYTIGDTAYARLNVYVILDAHSWCVLGFFISERENNQAVIGALRAAAQLSGYLPDQIMYDNSSANLSWQAQRCINSICRVHTPTGVGNARAKIIEPFFKHFNSQVLRFRPGYTHSPVMGNNINSKPNPEALLLAIKNKQMPTSKEQAIRELHEDFSLWNHKPFNGATSPLNKYQESIKNTLDFQRPLTELAKVEAFYTMPGNLKQSKGVDKEGSVRMITQFVPQEYSYTNNGLVMQVDNKRFDFLIDNPEVNKWLIGRKVMIKYDPANPTAAYLYENTADPKPIMHNGQPLIARAPERFAMAIMDRFEGETVALHEHLDKKKQQAALAEAINEKYTMIAKVNGVFLDIKPDNAYPKEVLTAAKQAIAEQIANGDEYRLSETIPVPVEKQDEQHYSSRWD